MPDFRELSTTNNDVLPSQYHLGAGVVLSTKSGQAIGSFPIHVKFDPSGQDTPLEPGVLVDDLTPYQVSQFTANGYKEPRWLQHGDTTMFVLQSSRYPLSSGFQRHAGKLVLVTQSGQAFLPSLMYVLLMIRRSMEFPKPYRQMALELLKQPPFIRCTQLPVRWTDKYLTSSNGERYTPQSGERYTPHSGEFRKLVNTESPGELTSSSQIENICNTEDNVYVPQGAITDSTDALIQGLREITSNAALLKSEVLNLDFFEILPLLVSTAIAVSACLGSVVWVLSTAPFATGVAMSAGVFMFKDRYAPQAGALDTLSTVQRIVVTIGSLLGVMHQFAKLYTSFQGKMRLKYASGHSPQSGEIENVEGEVEEATRDGDDDKSPEGEESETIDVTTDANVPCTQTKTVSLPTSGFGSAVTSVAQRETPDQMHARMRTEYYQRAIARQRDLARQRAQKDKSSRLGSFGIQK